jgi:hypothetical protein
MGNFSKFFLRIRNGNPIRGFAPGFANYKKGCTPLATASDKVYQLLAHGRWFSLGTLASSTTKTGRHEIAEILLNDISNVLLISLLFILTYRSRVNHS